MPKSKGRKPKKTERRHQPPARSAARKPALREFVSGPIRVREARTVEELRGFERWASMAGAGGPRTAARLVDARTQGVLGAGLGDPDRSHDAMLAAVMRGDFEAVTWTRTMALVATLDGEVVGGLLAGPAAQFLGAWPTSTTSRRPRCWAQCCSPASCTSSLSASRTAAQGWERR